MAKVLRALGIGGAAAALALALWVPGLLDRFEGTTFDLRARLLARPGPATPGVVTILVDQYSLTWARNLGVGWPWPRSLYGMVADFCARGGAKALVLDVLFTEETNEDQAQDEAFGQALARNGHVVAAVNLARSAGQGESTSWPAGLKLVHLDVGPPAHSDLVYPFAEFPIVSVASSAAYLANTNLPPDRDGVYRRLPLLTYLGPTAIPSEALGAYLAGGGSPPTLEGGRLVLGGRALPLDGRGRAILRYRGPSLTHRPLTAAAVLAAEAAYLEGRDPGPGSVRPEDLAGKYVLFGYSAPGLLDLKPSPLGADYPGVEVNATMLDNLLSGDFLAPTGWLLGIALLLALCLGASLAVSRAQGALAHVAAYGAFLALPVGLAFGAYLLGHWLPLVPLALGTLLALMGSSLESYATEGRQRRYLKEAFRLYLNPEVIEELIAHPERLRLGGERRELTIFFSDLAGFTGLSERLSPEDLTSFLNEYLSAMSDLIQAEGGTIDKYEGDAIIAFWNAPLAQADHARRGVRAALACQARLAELRPAFRACLGADLHARIGLNTGDAVVGNMGSARRFDYTMLGDQVNLASRLEGANKRLGTATLMSESVRLQAGGDVPSRDLGLVGVVGRREPVRVHEPMERGRYEAGKDLWGVFADGLARFQAGDFRGAAAAFGTTADRDPVAAAFLARCRDLEATPPPTWDGVWILDGK